MSAALAEAMLDRTFVLGTLAAIAFVSASTINALIAALLHPSLEVPAVAPLVPEPEPGSTLGFLERNLFAARRSSAAEVDPCPAVALPARLVATVIGDSNVAWFAAGDVLRSVQPGDRIEGAEVVSIERGTVRLSRDGACGEVTIAELDVAPASQVVEATHVRRVSQDEVVVPRSALEAALADPMPFARDARIVPRPGVGFSLFAIRRGGIADLLGFANGDVLERINGYRLIEPGWMSREELIRGPEIALDYTRRGERRTLIVRIE